MIRSWALERGRCDARVESLQCCAMHVLETKSLIIEPYACRSGMQFRLAGLAGRPEDNESARCQLLATV